MEFENYFISSWRIEIQRKIESPTPGLEDLLLINGLFQGGSKPWPWQQVRIKNWRLHLDIGNHFFVPLRRSLKRPSSDLPERVVCSISLLTYTQNESNFFPAHLIHVKDSNNRLRFLQRKSWKIRDKQSKKNISFFLKFRFCLRFKLICLLLDYSDSSTLKVSIFLLLCNYWWEKSWNCTCGIYGEIFSNGWSKILLALLKKFHFLLEIN